MTFVMRGCVFLLSSSAFVVSARQRESLQQNTLSFLDKSSSATLRRDTVSLKALHHVFLAIHPPTAPLENTRSRSLHRLRMGEALQDKVSSPRGTWHSLAPELSEGLRKHHVESLLPVQEATFKRIFDGEDTVIHAPTGSGKTLAYVLPLTSRLLLGKFDSHEIRLRVQGNSDEVEGVMQKRAHKRNSNLDREDPVKPRVLVVLPSMALARQVGKVWSTLYNTGFAGGNGVAAVFGGVPFDDSVRVVRREGGSDILIGTAGRLQDLHERNIFDTKQVKTIVLDEADSVLDFQENPEVQAFLRSMTHDYQLVLCSATINKFVRNFAKEIMDLPDESHPAFISVTDTGTAALAAPRVRHWSMSVKSTAYVGVAADLISTLAPRVTIIFVSTKRECEDVADQLARELNRIAGHVDVHSLHSEMPTGYQLRSIMSMRDCTGNLIGQVQRVLVATDLAARGLDLPAIDLVLQFGVPMKAGKAIDRGAYTQRQHKRIDHELYMHRSGRAGRVGGGFLPIGYGGDADSASDKPADAILLWDPTKGERANLEKLQTLRGVNATPIIPRDPPAPSDVMDAAYRRAVSRRELLQDEFEVIAYVKEKLIANMSKEDGQSPLLHDLARTMAALAGLRGMVPQRSLLTADPADRTVRVHHSSQKSFSAKELSEVLKPLGSGKLPRIKILPDHSAVFDIRVAKAEKLLETFRGHSKGDDGVDGFHIELPQSLRTYSDEKETTR